MLRRVAAIETLTPHRCLVAILLAANTAASATCPPPQAPREQLLQLAARNWVLVDDMARQSLALALLPCLGAPDPQGFAPPFAALALAEVARADRLETVWSAPQRQAMVAAAARFLHDTRDYRGFEESEGWRHAVAHGADLLMQLSLNPLLERAQLDQVLEAVAAQVLPPGHFYRYGEGERLAQPLLFTARRRLHSADEWSAWMARIVDRALPTAQVPARNSSLADVHNAKAFLLPLYATLQESNDAELRVRLLPGVAAALRRLP